MSFSPDYKVDSSNPDTGKQSEYNHLLILCESVAAGIFYHPDVDIYLYTV